MRALIPLLLAPLVLTALSACDAGEPPAAERRSAAQTEAARRACVAAELVRISRDEVETIQGSLPAESDTSAASRLSRRAQLAAAQFARALEQHAELRYGAFANADSAMNHSRTSADSTRRMQAAAGFAPRVPQEGTLEGNVFEAYQRRFAEVYLDEDHRCNWDL